MKIKKAFTLVELIIVIAIIAILSVLAYLEITKRVKISRDTSRTADLTTIEKALNIALVEKSKVPLPDENITISASGDIIGYQGVFGETVKDFIGNISKAPQDGADKTYYTYYVDKTQKYFQLLGFAENKTSYNPNNANAVDYLQRYILTRGNDLGIILDSTQTPVNQLLTGFDVMTGIVNDTGYVAIFDSNNRLSGTGQTLQWLRSNINNGGAGFSSPSNCPEGFIPVPGNKDFNQPGFCVAKYEMKQREGTAGTEIQNGGYKRVISPTEICGTGSDGSNQRCYKSYTESGEATDRLDGKIESKADGLPIVRLNQATAIQACKSMGNSYHLITSREYMTIARNIENQGENRTGGKVGVGGIYRGNTSFGNINSTMNSDKNTMDCFDGTDIDGNFLLSGGQANANSKVCELPNGRNKRALKLSNDERIRDLIGNAWENVNKADTINGNGYLSGINGYVEALVTLDDDPNDWETNISRHKIGRTGSMLDIARTKYGPSVNIYGTGQGVGNICGKGTNNVSNVFIRGSRGGSYLLSDSKGISGLYALFLSWDGRSLGFQSGFRCAR